MKHLKAMLLAGALLILPTASAQASRTMALLVGVADYTDASGIKDLHGPRNDVSILWRALQQRGVAAADITVLTDGLPAGERFPVAAGLPVSARILEELDRLASEVASGDTVLFYYSGHGTRQPDNPAEPEDEPETDGMDQVILPGDVGAYDPIKRTLRNAIVDDVIGRKIAAIRARGAFVWAVIDACHSGTVTRGDQVTRSVDPASLGIPATPAAATTRGGTRKGTLRAVPKPGEGGMVGFYAVESYDEAIERAFPGYDLPMVGEAETQRMGVFTFLLHRALTRNTAATYRELAQEIVSELNSDATGGKVPPPVFDGDLDAPVPGSTGSRLANAATGIVSGETISFPVGSLQGFDTGATLALYAPGQFDTPVGQAEVIEATAVTSSAGNINWSAGTTAIASGTLVATVSGPAINFRFVVSPPPLADHASDAEANMVSKALDTAFGEGAAAIGIELGEPGDPDADLLLRVKNERLWIVRPDRPWITEPGIAGETPSLSLFDPPEQLKSAVWNLARAAKLLRVAAGLAAGASADDGIVMTSSLHRLPGQDPRAECKGSEPPPGAQASSIDPLLPAAAGNCDFITIDVRNDSDLDYDVAGFYVDALGGVHAVPGSSTRRGCVRSLPAGSGKPLTFRFWIDTWDEVANRPSAIGAENFVVLAIPKGDARQPPKLCALTQPTLTAMQQTRSVEGTLERKGGKLSALLGAVGGETTRSFSAAAEDDGPAMSGRLFVFDVRP